MASIWAQVSISKLSKELLNILLRYRDQSRISHFCSDGVVKNNCLLFTKTWQHVPDRKTVNVLRKTYPDPVQLVDSLLQPITDLHKCHHPQLEIKSSGHLWRAYLHFTWPLKFTICGASADPSSAELNAYLLACDTLKNIGILDVNGNMPSYKEKLLHAQDRVSHELLPGWILEFCSQCQLSKDGQHHWTAVLALNWPTFFKVTSNGLTQKDAERNASLKAFIKLKGLRLLDHKNDIRLPKILILPRDHQCQEPFIPHYELYVDASLIGVGAYIINHDLEEDSGSTPVRWFQDPWPEHIKERFLTPHRNSTFAEYCGVLIAVYTWKKKFAGKNVRVFNDNLSVVNMINHGLPTRPGQYYKPFIVLQKTCLKYNIHLRAQHLHRENNMAADNLSKLKTSAFREIVPNASPTSKKTIKLLFCLPLIREKEETHYGEPDKLS